MKFRISKEAFLDGLQKVQHVVSTRTTLPILSNVLLVAKDGRLQFTTTDLDVGMTGSVEAQIDKEGATTLPAKRLVSIDAIQKTVAEHFDVRLADMTSRRRPANIAFPRQIAMYLSRSLTKGSLMEIGEAFGGRDHGTVIHACKKVREKIDRESGLKETVARIEAQLRR